MPNTAKFDVIIVYNGSIATSASTTDELITTPFPSRPSYNLAYSYFLKMLAVNHLKSAFSTSGDIIGSGIFQSYWTCQGKIWTKHAHTCQTSQIFDKFSPTDQKGKKLRTLLFASPTINAFNQPEIFEIFFDKQKTFNTLPSYAIPTVTVAPGDQGNITRSLAQLSALILAHPHALDFSDSLILKDRFGAGGLNIYKFKFADRSNIFKMITDHPKLSFILQPLVKFDHGFSYHGLKKSADIRLIYLNGELETAYIRMAKTGDFRCNQHQGGSLSYLKLGEIPANVLTSSRAITKKLNKKSTLFTLDFIVSNSNHAYFLEGNTGPGLTWDTADEIDKYEAKKLIKSIVKVFVERLAKIRLSKSKSRRPTRRTAASKTPFLPRSLEILSPWT